MFTIGVDPGASGALALLDDEHMIDVYDMPVFRVKVGKTINSQIDIAGVVTILQKWREKGELHIFCESVFPTPGKGELSMFRFGVGYGILQGIFGTLHLPVTYVHPAVWKRITRTPKEKDGARQRASQIFPVWNAAFHRVKDDGRAEAALIGLYGHRERTGAII